MKDIDWSKAPEGYPVWIEDLAPDTGFDGSGWHRDDGDRYTDEDGEYWTKPEEGIYRVHSQAPQWNGEGLPPVGVVCECQNDKFQWLRGEIVYVGSDRGDKLAVMQTDTEMLYGSAGEFRPVRTPEQTAAEEREVAIKAMVNRFALHGYPDVPFYELFQQMYDCGYRMTAEDER